MTIPRRLRVMTVLGTRPEIVRLSRVMAAFDDEFDHVLVHTGQNADPQLSDVFFTDLALRPPDRYLGVDTSTLGRSLGGILIGVESALDEYEPDVMMVLGDTNSSLSALMAKRRHVPVYHMEAGNRSFDANVPEEVNRHVVDHIADFNLVYTEHARRNLLAEGLHPRTVALSGSPMAEVLHHYRDGIEKSRVLDQLELTPGGYLVVSAHRQENVDDPSRLRQFVRILEALHGHYGIPLVLSTHPRTRARLEEHDVGQLPGTIAHAPFGFLDYVQLQQNARCVLSDSGTISEESSILGFPAVTLRNAIERPEALEAGSIISTDLEPDVVVSAVDMAVRQCSDGRRPTIPPGYEILNCSVRVVHFIRSTAHVAHEWSGVRSSRDAEEEFLESR